MHRYITSTVDQRLIKHRKLTVSVCNTPFYNFTDSIYFTGQKILIHIFVYVIAFLPYTYAAVTFSRVLYVGELYSRSPILLTCRYVYA